MTWQYNDVIYKQVGMFFITMVRHKIFTGIKLDIKVSTLEQQWNIMVKGWWWESEYLIKDKGTMSKKSKTWKKSNSVYKTFLPTTFYLSAFIGYLLPYKVILPQKYNNKACNDETGNLDS